MSRPFPWERLSSADASNFVFEHPGQAYGIGMVGLLDGASLLDAAGQPDVDRLRTVLAPRVAAVRRLSQRVHFTRWGQGRPVWVDAEADLAVHVRRGPRLEDDTALARLCGHLLGEPLPRYRPLWDLLVAAGPAASDVTLVLRLHHALADGSAGVRIMQALFDPDAGSGAGQARGGPPPAGRPAGRPARRPPTGRELAVDAGRQRLADVTGGLRGARDWPGRARSTAAGVRRTMVIARGGMPRTSLLGPTGAERGVTLASVDLEPLRSAAHAAGATVNDLLLSAVADATGALLRARGEHLPAGVPVSVPVSLREGVRGPGEPAGNRVGVMLVRLPLDLPDATERLRTIATATRSAKEGARAAGSLELTRTRLGTRLFDVVSRHQRTVGLFVTNVPGPRGRLSLAGAPLVHVWPLSLIAGNIRVAVAALSYAGELSLTTTWDARSCPDAEVFTRALEAALRP